MANASGRRYADASARAVRTKMTHERKEALDAITVYRQSSDFNVFSTELRIALEIRHPFSGRFFNQMRSEVYPTVDSMRHLAERLDIDEQEFIDFVVDLWNVLLLKMKGTGLEIVRLLLERNLTTEECMLRGPCAWFELQREARGHTADRKLELHKLIINPPKIRDWSGVPAGVRVWDT